MHPILKHGFLHNQWLWFHILGAGVLFRVASIWLTNQQAFIAVAGIAVSWEIYEYFSSDIEKIYGNKKRFYLDAFGDIAGAILIMLIMVL